MGYCSPEGRRCTFKILWGSDVGIQDEESWLTAIKSSGTTRLKQAGAWYTLIGKDDKEYKFQASKWIVNLNDEKFRQAIEKIYKKQ